MSRTDLLKELNIYLSELYIGKDTLTKEEIAAYRVKINEIVKEIENA